MNLALALLISLLVYLDSWPVGQFMLGRPVLLLPLLGLALGMPLVGVWLGLTLELITLRSLPMGSALPPDPALAGVWTLLGLVRAELPAEEAWTLVGLALLMALPLCWAAPWLTLAQRRINGVLWRPLFLKAVEAGDARACGRAMGFTLAQTAALGLAASALALVLVEGTAPALLPLAERLAHGRLGGILPLPWALLALGLGGLWRHAAGRGGNQWLWVGLGAALPLAWLVWRMP